MAQVQSQVFHTEGLDKDGHLIVGMPRDERDARVLQELGYTVVEGPAPGLAEQIRQCPECQKNVVRAKIER